MEEVVWLHEYRRFGFLISQGAYVSTIQYQDDDGHWIKEAVENDDYDLWEERATDYDTNDGN
jgi:hypothetical protein